MLVELQEKSGMIQHTQDKLEELQKRYQEQVSL